MPASIKLENGSHKSHPLTGASVSNADYATFFARRGAMKRLPRDILWLIYLTAKDVASVPWSARQKR